LVAFYRDDEALKHVPKAFVAYSLEELRLLFIECSTSSQTLKLIHEAKKLGGKVIE